MTRAPQPESRFLTVNGLRLHYLDWGNLEAPPLVYVPGFMMTAAACNGAARRLRDRFHILAADLRGHGESAWASDGAYEYADHLADLEGLVDELGLDRFTLVGASLGGKVGIMYAGAHPERVERLVLNDVGPDTGATRQYGAGSAGPRPKEFPSPEAALPYLRKVLPALERLGAEEQREQARAQLRPRPDGLWAWKLDPVLLRQRAARGGPPPTPPLWPVLERLTCPVLVVWGRESPMLTEEQARRMIAVLPHGELVAVPGAGHTPWLTEPEALAALQRFLVGPE